MKVEELIQQSIDAHGGTIWNHPTSLVLNGCASLYDDGKKKHHFDLYQMHRVFPRRNNEARKENGKVSIIAKEMESLFFHLTFDGAQSEVTLSEQASIFSDHFKWSNNFGFGIIRFAIQEKLECKFIEHDKDDHCHYFEVIDKNQQRTLFGIGKKESFIRYMAFETPLGMHQRSYSNFKRDENGFVLATHLNIKYGEDLFFEVNWDSFEVNVDIPDSIFIR